jgi:hypothetical protein
MSIYGYHFEAHILFGHTLHHKHVFVNDDDCDDKDFSVYEEMRNNNEKDNGRD